MVLSRVEAGAFANLTLHNTLAQAGLPPADAGLATELTLGTLRHLRRVDWTLEGALRDPLDDLPVPIRQILRTGAYQLLFLSRVPAHAAVHEAVDLARHRGHPGTARLVNAVLRRIAAEGERPLPDPAADPVARLAVEFSHPAWLVARWVRRRGADGAAALCGANNAPAPGFVRVNAVRQSVDGVTRQLAASGAVVTPTVLPEGLAVAGSFDERHQLVTQGVLTVQDLGAMLVTHALDPQPGETVIDACAAPGGKTTHIAERMGNRGRVIACDVHAGKIQTVARRAEVMGLGIIETRHLDARQLGAGAVGQADRVLIDAPCTGLGVVRRRPEIKWRVQEGDLPELARLQGSLLHGVCGAVRPGGVLVYSVCTTEPEEGPDVVAGFLRDHGEFALDPLPLPDAVNPHTQEVGTAMLLPHLHGTDGFFIARMRRADHRSA